MSKITSVVALIVNILKIFGFIPLFVDKNGVFANFVNFSFLTLSIVFWTVNLHYRLYAIENILNGQVLSLLGLQQRIIIPYFLIILLIIGSMVGKKKMQTIVRLFEEFDERVSE